MRSTWLSCNTEQSKPLSTAQLFKVNTHKRLHTISETQGSDGSNSGSPGALSLSWLVFLPCLKLQASAVPERGAFNRTGSGVAHPRECMRNLRRGAGIQGETVQLNSSSCWPLPPLKQCTCSYDCIDYVMNPVLLCTSGCSPGIIFAPLFSSTSSSECWDPFPL